MRRRVTLLIARREIRDLLRDRRTLLLILVLPLLLYPLFGLAGLAFAKTLTEQSSRVGIVGMEHLPDRGPMLLSGGRFSEELLKGDAREGLMRLEPVPLTGDGAASLKERAVEVVLVVPEGFAADLSGPQRPELVVLDREGDERSKLAARRLDAVLRAWAARLREARFEQAGLRKDFDRVFDIRDSNTKKPAAKQAADELRDTFVKAFPFILMMWLVAGAIQPAVDVTAGEKERGTMETLLISPAERSEIVVGKFLAVFSFTYATVVWNVIWLTAAALVLQVVLGFPIVKFPGLLGCLLLGVPLAMFFSAISIALGVFARSTKEGQYYLMPLILFTMPLAMWSMMPGMEITPGNALVPVTGAMLMQQEFLSVSGRPIPWGLLLPVLGGLGVSIAFALWLAVVQFRRESVLFRETGPARRGGFFPRSRAR